MYEDVSAVTKAGSVQFLCLRLIEPDFPGMENKSGNLITTCSKLRTDTVFMRLISTPSSIKAATLFPSDPQIYFLCSHAELLQGKWRCGHTTRKMKILRKVKSSEWIGAIINSCTSIDATVLDVWVLDQLRTLISSAIETIPVSGVLHLSRVPLSLCS